MRNKLLLSKKIKELIPVLEICIGSIFLILKVRNIYLYKNFINSIPEGLFELTNYELMRYGDLLLWGISIFTGCSYWINKKIYWVFTNTLLCVLFLKIGLSLLWFNDIHLTTILTYILFIYISVLFIIIQISLYRIKEMKTIFKSNNIKLLSIIVSSSNCLLYYYFEVTYPFL